MVSERTSPMVTPRAIIGSVLGLALTTTAGFTACRGPTPEPVPMPTGSATSAPLASTPATTVHATSDDASAPAPVDTVAAAVAAARACTAPSSRITNQPDGGQVFVNAWRRQDAGNIDRLQSVVDTIAGSAAQFQCCFDVWTASHPGVDGKLMLTLELEAKGAVKSAAIDPARSTIDDVVTHACVVDVAKSLTYAPSPSDNATLVEYPFRVSGQWRPTTGKKKPAPQPKSRRWSGTTGNDIRHR